MYASSLHIAVEIQEITHSIVKCPRKQLLFNICTPIQLVPIVKHLRIHKRILKTSWEK